MWARHPRRLAEDDVDRRPSPGSSTGSAGCTTRGRESKAITPAAVPMLERVTPPSSEMRAVSESAVRRADDGVRAWPCSARSAAPPGNPRPDPPGCLPRPSVSSPDGAEETLGCRSGRVDQASSARTADSMSSSDTSTSRGRVPGARTSRAATRRRGPRNPASASPATYRLPAPPARRLVDYEQTPQWTVRGGRFVHAAAAPATHVEDCDSRCRRARGGRRRVGAGSACCPT